MFQTLPASIPPEISRSDLLTTILQLKALGINDLVKFDWVTAPPAETILRTLERLHSHGIVDDNGQLTMIGEQISEFPVDTSIAKMVGLHCFNIVQDIKWSLLATCVKRFPMQ